MPFFRFAIVAAVLTAFASGGVAVAGDCEKTRRSTFWTSGGKLRAHTTVINRSSKPVTIGVSSEKPDRGTPREPLAAKLSPGDEIVFKDASQGATVTTVTLNSAAATATGTCKWSAEFGKNNNYANSVWRPQINGAVCDSNLVVGCSKSWQKDSSTWSTTFMILDPLEAQPTQ